MLSCFFRNILMNLFELRVMKKWIWLGLVVMVSCTTSAQKVSVSELKTHIGFLASDELKGRGTGTPEERKAATYLAEYFKKLGLKPKGTEGYFQAFQAPLDTVHVLNALNVVAFLDNQAEQTIVIGAHYDHLGEGFQRGSLDPSGRGKIHNGADDNASGTAGVLEMARLLSTNKIKEKHNYLFICFSAEEMGLIGSKYFVNHPTIDLSKVKAMINFDMIGRFEEKRGVTIGGWGTSSTWSSILPPVLAKANMKVNVDSSGAGASDHTSFYTKKIPVLYFFTGVHGDYHKPSDDIEWIQFEGQAKVLEVVNQIVMALDQVPGVLPFKETPLPVSQSMSFKVTMGVLLDYSFQGPGIKVDGVTANRPAQKAGVQEGDLILRLGAYPLQTIYDYMGALGKFEKGQTTEIEVQRGKEKIILNLVF